MNNALTSEEMVSLLQKVFPRFSSDKALAILIDVPNNKQNDHPNWLARRKIALNWQQMLDLQKKKLGLDTVDLIAYASVDGNNAKLPDYAYLVAKDFPATSSDLESMDKKDFQNIFASYQLFLTPTQYSTTAPMKLNAKEFGFRAATMGGFCEAMIPALRVDYEQVHKKVEILKAKLGQAIAADVVFIVDGTKEHKVYFDLRSKNVHASSGLFPTKGMAGNLPSGESYIVPFEGKDSLTKGTLPVQLETEVVLYKIEHNRAYEVIAEGDIGKKQAEYLQKEPVYGNIAELGFGVLKSFDIEPIQEVLLDEKLGFHVAFGRSDHFGGKIGVEDFSAKAVHIDRVYIPQMQPRILLRSIHLVYEDNARELLMENYDYKISWD